MRWVVGSSKWLCSLLRLTCTLGVRNLLTKPIHSENFQKKNLYIFDRFNGFCRYSPNMFHSSIYQWKRMPHACHQWNWQENQWFQVERFDGATDVFPIKELPVDKEKNRTQFDRCCCRSLLVLLFISFLHRNSSDMTARLTSHGDAHFHSTSVHGNGNGQCRIYSHRIQAHHTHIG